MRYCRLLSSNSERGIEQCPPPNIHAGVGVEPRATGPKRRLHAATPAQLVRVIRSGSTGRGLLNIDWPDTEILYLHIAMQMIQDSASGRLNQQ